MAKKAKDFNENNSAEEQVSSAETQAGNENTELSEAEILRNELEAVQSQLEEYKNKHLRALAETQTVKHRLQQDIKRAKEQGADKAILAVLPVYDDLKRALEAANADPNSITEGVNKVLDNLRRSFESLGIKESAQVGDKFDPNIHEALTAMPTDDHKKDGTIAQVFESGFTKDDRTVKAAKVVVFQK